MSVMPYAEPRCAKVVEPSVELDIEARTRALTDGFTVRRLLPSMARRMVGPFIFFDHMGPVRLAADHGLDVRPHPHINLATVTYLFEGEILHPARRRTARWRAPHLVELRVQLDRTDRAGEARLEGAEIPDGPR